MRCCCSMKSRRATPREWEIPSICWPTRPARRGLLRLPRRAREASWRLLFLSDGEVSLANHMEQAGKGTKANPPKLGHFSNFSDSSPCAVFGQASAVSRDFHDVGRSVQRSSARSSLRDEHAVRPALSLG